VQVKYEGAAESDETLEMLAGGFAAKFRFVRRNEREKIGAVIEDHEAGALLVEMLEGGQVREDFGDGPTVGLRFPLEEIVRKVAEEKFEEAGSFFEKGDRSLDRDNIRWHRDLAD